jgi:hypothetical protein
MCHFRADSIQLSDELGPGELAADSRFERNFSEDS